MAWTHNKKEDFFLILITQLGVKQEKNEIDLFGVPLLIQMLMDRMEREWEIASLYTDYNQQRDA